MPSNTTNVFCVLLTMHPGMILVNNQIDAQFFMSLCVDDRLIADGHLHRVT